MERLVAADPAPDAERLTAAEQAEADALLGRLLAREGPPAVAERRAGPVRRRGWMLVAAGAAACALLAAVAAIDRFDSDAPDAGVVEKAVAAVSQEDVAYHVQVRARIPGAFNSGRPRTVYLDSWHTTDGRKHEKMFAARGGRRGKLLFEIAGRLRPGRTSGPALRYDPRANVIDRSGFGPALTDTPTIDPYRDPRLSLRALQAQGRLRVTGTTRVGGRPAYRLTSKQHGSPPERVEFLVDAETYLPLAEHRWWGPDPKRMYRFDSRYLVYERLPLDARSRARLALDPHPGATCAAGAGKLRADRPLVFPNPCPPSGREGPARTP